MENKELGFWSLYSVNVDAVVGGVEFQTAYMKARKEIREKLKDQQKRSGMKLDIELHVDRIAQRLVNNASYNLGRL